MIVALAIVSAIAYLGIGRAVATPSVLKKVMFVDIHSSDFDRTASTGAIVLCWPLLALFGAFIGLVWLVGKVGRL